MRLVLDTDIGSDVDDALALAFALRHPDIDLVAVTTVADDVVKRAQIAKALLRMAGHDAVPVAAGVGWHAPPAGRRSWLGHEGNGIELEHVEPEDAIDVLLASRDVEIATVGMQSNIAAALDRDPGFVDRVKRLDVMGGVFEPIMHRGRDVAATGEHNLMCDPKATIRSLNAGFDMLIVPLDVTVRAPLRTSHLDALRAGDELCRALASLIDVWTHVATLPDGIVAFLHDPLTVACAVDRRFVTSEVTNISVAMDGDVVRTSFDPSGRPAEVVRSVDGDAFADFWLETVLG